MDASSFYYHGAPDSRRATGVGVTLSPLPRFAISPCGEPRVAPSPNRRATVGDERDLPKRVVVERHYQSGTYSSTVGEHLSPVEEMRASALPTSTSSAADKATVSGGTRMSRRRVPILH